MFWETLLLYYMGGSALSQDEWKSPKLFCYYCSFLPAAFQILLSISPKEKPPMSVQGFTKEKKKSTDNSSYRNWSIFLLCGSSFFIRNAVLLRSRSQLQHSWIAQQQDFTWFWGRNVVNSLIKMFRLSLNSSTAFLLQEFMFFLWDGHLCPKYIPFLWLVQKKKVLNNQAISREKP